MSLSRRRKAAMIVQILISHGGSLSLSQLPEELQETLTDELGAIRLVDRQTVAQVAEEFAHQLEQVGLSAPGTREGAIMALSAHLSPHLADRLRTQMDSVRNGDHWPRIIELPVHRILPIMQVESIEICAVILSKLPVAKAAEVLVKTPGDRARRIAFALSKTADISPEAVRRIGSSLAQDYGTSPTLAFEKAPVQRLGAILNFTASDTRESVLAGLGVADPAFESDVRKAIFTFKDIAQRVKPTDVSICIRSIDSTILTTAIAAGLAGDNTLEAASEFILANISQRMAGQIREDVAELGTVRAADGETAMNELTKAIRELVDTNQIQLIDPDATEVAA